MFFLQNESEHIFQHKKLGHGVSSWERTSESRNHYTYIVPLQKSSSMWELRPPLELGEGVESLCGKAKERGKGDREVKEQPTVHTTVDPIISMGNGWEWPHLQSQRADYCEMGTLEHKPARLFLFDANTDCRGQTMRYSIAEMNGSSFSFTQTDSLGLPCSLWFV